MEMWWWVIVLVPVMVQVSAQLDVTVTIDPDTRLRQTSDKFLGLSVSPSTLLTDGSYSATTMNMLKSLPPAYIRVRARDIDTEVVTSTKTMDDQMFSERQWTDLNQLILDTGMSLIVGLDRDLLHQPGYTERLLKLFDRHGYNAMWQIQYEPSEVSKTNPLSGMDLGRDLVNLRTMLDAICPNKKFPVVGPDFVGCDEYSCLVLLRDFLKEADSVVDVITLQLENKITLQGGSTEMFERLGKLQNVVRKIVLNTQMQLESSRGLSEKKIWFVESEHTEDALMWALKLGQAAVLGYQTILHRPVHLLYPTPDYWVSALYHRFVGNTVLDSKLMSEDSSVSTFVHCSTSHQKSGALVVWGVNTRQDTAKLMLGVPTRQDVAHLYVLTTDGLEERGTLLNGKPLHMVEEALPRLSPHIVLNGTTTPITIPAQSVFFIILPDVRASACLPYLSKNIQLSMGRELLNSQKQSVQTQSDVKTRGNSKFPIKLNENVEHYNFETDHSRNDFENKMRDQLKETMKERMQAIINSEEKANESEQSTQLAEENISGTNQQVNIGNSAWLSNLYNSTDDTTQKEWMFLIDFLLKYDEFMNFIENRSSKQVVLKQTYSPRSLSYKDIKDDINKRVKRSESNDTVVALTEPKHMRLSTLQKRMNWLRRFKSTQSKTNKTKESENIHYLPGEFYKTLKNLKLDSNSFIKDVEDPNEAVVSAAEESTKCKKNDSELKVTKKKDNDHKVDTGIVESATEQIKKYYDTVGSIGKNIQIFKNSKKILNEDTKCCSEKGLLGKSPPFKIKGKDETELTDGTEIVDDFHKSLFQASKSHNDGQRYSGSGIMSERKKREIDNSEKSQPNTKKTVTEEEDLLRKPDYSEESRMSAYLKELTDEGEQLLKDLEQNNRFGVPVLSVKDTSREGNQTEMLPETEVLKKSVQEETKSNKQTNTTLLHKTENLEHVDINSSKNNSDHLIPEKILKQNQEKLQSEVFYTTNSSLNRMDLAVPKKPPQHLKTIDSISNLSSTYLLPNVTISHHEDKNSHTASVIDKTSEKIKQDNNDSSKIISHDVVLTRPLSATNSTQLNKFITDYKTQRNNFVSQMKPTKTLASNTPAISLTTIPKLSSRQATYSSTTASKGNNLSRRSKPTNLIAARIRQDLLSTKRRERLEALKARLEEARQRLSLLSHPKNQMSNLDITKLVTKREMPFSQEFYKHINQIQLKTDVQQNEKHGLNSLKNNILGKFLEDRIVKLPLVHTKSTVHRLTKQIPETEIIFNQLPLLRSINKISRSRRSTKNAIERNEIEMKALLTNELIKEHPSNNTADHNPNEGAFRSMLRKTLKAARNKTGIDRMLELAKQYNKTNPDSVEIFRFHETKLNSDSSENENKAIEVTDFKDTGTVKQDQFKATDSISLDTTIVNTNQSEHGIKDLFNSENNILSIFINMVEEVVKTLSNVNKTA